ncbi:UBAP1-MVB12-associated (UMA)-domain containing protein 1 [Melanotaenia boesemani]|uniref:UBAP1-MVB12-associated (UMA)-domain containing protein 1 n=1 Tax=Melanotaenia boesemani TaxID=1250792 RepID=UPI001C048341|nr:UBAP1-MVB12-associated (UMA)-domain containing protein 1 [Melanotaenia boesemani]
MLSFLGFRKDSKKSTSDKEVDGGFVIVGETPEDRSRKTPSMNVGQLYTNVVVQPSKPSYPAPPPPAAEALPTPLFPLGTSEGPPAVEAASALPDLLGDIPFTLAPHVLAMQAGCPLVPDVLLSRDINYNLASFQYDFTLENSVLHNG